MQHKYRVLFKYVSDSSIIQHNIHLLYHMNYDIFWRINAAFKKQMLRETSRKKNTNKWNHFIWYTSSEQS